MRYPGGLSNRAYTTPLPRLAAKLDAGPGGRQCRLYPICLELEYSFSVGMFNRYMGRGRTIEISSSGLLFESDRPLSAGLPMELRVEWPGLLDGRIPLNLILHVTILGAEGPRAVARISAYEFRTSAKRLLGN